MRFTSFNVALSFLFLMAGLKAEPAINEEYVYYSVKPSSIENLLQALNHASPIRESGELFHGHTDSYVKWNFWWNESEGKCAINRVTTEVKLKYTLPKLVTNNPNQALKSVWSKWYPALVKHEKGHGSFAIDAARRVESAIERLPAFNGCDVLSNEANSAGHRVLDKLKKRDAEYDKRTRHGETQGASLLLYL